MLVTGPWVHAALPEPWVETPDPWRGAGSICQRDVTYTAHGPLPWLGNKDLDGSNLKQLYSKEKISQGRNSTTITYEVHALTANGRNEKRVSGLDSSEQALYIEQEIERYFRVEDTPVRGQIGE